MLHCVLILMLLRDPSLGHVKQSARIFESVKPMRRAEPLHCIQSSSVFVFAYPKKFTIKTMAKERPRGIIVAFTKGRGVRGRGGRPN